MMIVASVADAFTLFPEAHWTEDQNPLEDAITLDVDTFPADFVEPQVLAEAIRDALLRWTVESGAAIDLRFGGPTNPTDRGLRVFYSPNIAGDELAVARRTVSATAEVNSCEIVVYGRNAAGPVTWHFGPSHEVPATSMDFRTVFAHEIGHCMGLDHSNVDGAVMSPSISEGQWRPLHDDDLAGMRAIYGDAEPAVELLDTTGDLVATVIPGERRAVQLEVVNVGNVRIREAVVTAVGASPGLSVSVGEPGVGDIEIERLIINPPRVSLNVLVTPQCTGEEGWIDVEITASEACRMSCEYPSASIVPVARRAPQLQCPPAG